jgi:uncharacterized protein HemX
MNQPLTTSQRITLILVAIAGIGALIYFSPLSKLFKKTPPTDQQEVIDELDNQVRQSKMIIQQNDSAIKSMTLQLDSLNELQQINQATINLLKKKRTYVTNINYSTLTDSDITRNLSARYKSK